MKQRIATGGQAGLIGLGSAQNNSRLDELLNSSSRESNVIGAGGGEICETKRLRGRGDGVRAREAL